MTSQKDNEDISNGQRAFWAFLGFTLVGPFFAALAILIILVLAPILKLDPLIPTTDLPLGAIAMRSFIWSAVPAALTALAMVPFLLREGRFAPSYVAMAAVVAFTIAHILFPVDIPQNLLTALAVLAGLVAIAVRYAMDLGGLLRED
ncbi:MAG: hypothetical protein ACRBCJ_07750 [Hyphomicrobiaceae bacterium]